MHSTCPQTKDVFKRFMVQRFVLTHPVENIRMNIFVLCVHLCVMILHELIHSQSSYYLPGEDGRVIVSYVEYAKS